jgi:hypothetical protein
MSSKGENAGMNTRYSDARFQGYNGAHGYNDAPINDSQEVAAALAGTSDGAVTVPIAATNACVTIEVTAVYDGAATIIVGYAGDTDLLVTLADAVDLTTTGIKKVVREVAWPAAAVPRVTIGGAPTTGACTVTVEWEV